MKSVSMKWITAVVFSFFSLINTLSAQDDWQEIGEIPGLVDISGATNIGYSVDINGDGSRLVLSGIYRTNSSERSPYVAVYEYNGTSWSLVNPIIPFPVIVRDVKISEDGTRIAIGVSLEVSGTTDHVVIYEDTGTSWVQLGNLILSDQRGTLFGSSISISSDCLRVAIGDRGDDTNGSSAGKVVVYSYNGSNWVQTGQTLFGSQEDSRLGNDVALSGDGTSLLVADELANNQGQLIAYSLENDQWVQKGNLISGTDVSNRFGSTLSINNDGSIIAASSDISTSGDRDSQFVRVYELIGSFWSQQGKDLKSNIPEDQFGSALDLSSSGKRLAISAPLSKDNTDSDEKGIVYVYEFENGSWVDLGNRIQKSVFSRLGSGLAVTADGLTICAGDGVIGGVSFSGAVNVYQFQNDFLASYSFNSSFLDNSINSNDATNSGAVLTEDRFGKAEYAVSFDGSNQITTPLTDQPKTISLWYKEDVSGGTIFTWGQQESAGYYYGYELISTGTGLQFFVSQADGSNSPFTSSISLTTSKDTNWHQFVVTEEVSGQLSFYIDNVLTETFTASSANPINWEGSTGLLTIGENFQGSIDEVRFYLQPLTETEITESFGEQGDAILLGDYSFTSNLNDDSGLENDVTNNGATFTTDRFGSASSALSFNGNSSVSIDNTPSIAGFSGAYSASMWVNIQAETPSEPMSIINKGLDLTSISVYLNTDLTLSFLWEDEFDQENILTTTEPLSPSRYYLISVTVDTDANTTNLYVDQELVASNTFISPPSANIDPIYLGAAITSSSTLNRYFTGIIDDVKIYNNKVLTIDEIRTTYGVNDWNPDLLGDFTFNGGASDESNYANVGSIRGSGVSLAENRFGIANNAFSFSGSGYVAHSHIDSYDLGQTRDFSISGWFNSTSTSNGTIFDKSDGSVGYRLTLNADGSLVFSINNTSESFSLSTDAGYDDGEWHYFVVQVDRNAGISLIIDGSTNFSNSSITENLSFDTNEDLLLGVAAGAGNISPNSLFRGSLDNIQFWSRTLTTEELLDIFNNGVESVAVTGSALSEDFSLALTGSTGVSQAKWAGSLRLNEGSFRFSLDNSTTLYGDTNLDGQAELDGNAITLSAAGIYYIEYTPSTNNYSFFEITGVGILGSARDGAETGWNEPDLDMVNNGDGIFYVENLDLFDGEFKFRANDSWDANWGDDDPTGAVTSLLFENFESDVPVFDMFGGNVVNVITNPDPSGINVTNSVIEVVKGDQVWGGVYFDVDEKLAFTSESAINLKVWAPNTGFDFLLKLENSDNSDVFQEYEVAIPVANEWVELSFPLNLDNNNTPAVSDLYDRIVLFPGWEAAAAGSSFYIDDIILSYESATVYGANIPVESGQYTLLLDVLENTYSLHKLPFNGSDIRNNELITSSGLYTDSGGAENDYSANENYTSTILPEVPGEAINLEFTEFNVEANYDFLYIYDGPSIDDPLIGEYTGGNAPQSIVATNLSGALTLRFVSDEFVEESGWQANISTSLLKVPDLVGEYFFNDNVDDNSLAGNNGSNFNATYVAGRLPQDSFGGAYSFDGSSSYLSVPDSWTLTRATSEDFSISGWFKSTENGILFDKSDGSIGYLGWLQTDGTLLFSLTESSVGNASLQTSSTWNDGMWHFFSMEADRDTGLFIYVDNNLEASNLEVSNTFSVATSEDFLIAVAGDAGNTTLENYFNGELDDFRIYSKLLDEEERFRIFNVGGWFDSQNLLSYLKFSGNNDDELTTGLTSISNTGTFGEDRFGQESSALYLDGISQFNSHTVEPLISASNPSLDRKGSVSIWVNPASLPAVNATIFQFEDPDLAAQYLIEMVHVTNGLVGARLKDEDNSEILFLSQQMELNRWSHVVFTWDTEADLFLMYVDGALVASENIGTVVPPVLNTGFILNKGYSMGRFEPDYYHGGMDDMRIYKGALNAEQILEIYTENGWPSQLVSAVSLTISDGTNENEFSLRQEFETSSVNWSGSLYLNEGQQILFDVVNNGSTLTYGDVDGEDNIADRDASAITITESGDYYVRFNASSNEYLIYAINSIGFLGSARTGDESGWLGDDDDFANEGGGTYILRNVELADGEFKFRANDSWNVLNWGDNDDDGIMEVFGANTLITAGQYDIVFNLYERTYSLTPTLGRPILYSASPVSSTEIKLRWENIENETGYRIFRADDLINPSYEFVTDVGSEVMEFTDSGLTPNKGYWYILQTFNDQLVNSGNPAITSTFSNNLDTKNESFSLMGGAGNDYGRDITFDDQGNYYILGTFNQSIEIAGTTISALNDGLFVAKYNSAHVAQWAVGFDPAGGSIANTDIVANAIKISPDGTVYVTGFYNGVINSVASYQTGSNEYENNLFVISLTQDGVTLDTRILASTGFSTGDKIDFDSESNLYISGQFNGDATFAGASLSGGGPVILKWLANGEESWSISPTQSTYFGIGRAYGLAIDRTSNVIYATGISYGTTDFSNNGTGVYVGSELNFDIFLASYNEDGSFNWVKNIDSERTDVSYDVVLDPSNNPVIAGYFNGPSLSIGSKSYSNTEQFNEILLVKYDQSGNVLNSSVATSDLSEYTLGLASNSKDLFLTGYKDPVLADFGGLEVENGKGFLASFDGTELTPNWVEVIEGNSIGVSVAASDDYVYLAGRGTNALNLAGNVLNSNNESDDAMFGVFELENLAAGLVGYYTFDGGSTDDFSGNGNNGLTVNSPLFSKDRYGLDASSFEPNNNETYIEIDHNGAFDFRGAFTVAMWVRLNDYSDEERDILFKDDAFGILSINNSGRIAYDWKNSNNENVGIIATLGDVIVQRNQWTYIALTVDENANARILVNGISQINDFVRDGNIIGSPSEVFTISQTITVGNFAYISSNVFNDTFLSDANGDIDDVRIYSGTSLTQSEIQSIYNAEVSGGSDRLVAQYDFTAGDLGDISGNHFDGEFRNSQNQAIGVVLTQGLDGDADGALDFDNNGDYMNTLHERSINLQDNFTVNFWVKPESGSDSPFGDVMFSDANGSRLMYSPENQIFYHYENTSGDFPAILETGNSLEIGSWQMISYSIIDGNLKVYKNGVEIINGDVSDFRFKLSGSFTVAQNDIAGAGDLRYMDGAIDNVSVYQRVLTSEELIQIFNEVDNRLIAYYPFDGDAVDFSGNGYDGSPQNLTLTEDRFGDANSAYSFNGSSSQVSADLLNHPQGEVSLTYMAWIKPSVSSQSAAIINVGEDIDNRRSSLWLNGTNLAYIGNNNDVTSSVTPSVDQWSHVAITKSGRSIDFFLNGSYVETLSTAAGQDIQSTSATIGSAFGTREFFNGGIDEVRIFSVPLSNEEILAIYDAEAPSTASGDPDLAVSINSSPSASVIGFGGYSISGRIINTSQSELAVNQQVNLAVYLSDDSNFDSGDLALSSNSQSVNLEVNSDQSYTITYGIPSSVTPNNYNLIVRIDDSELLSESNENNNIITAPIEILNVLTQPTNLALSNATNTSFQYSWNALDASTWEYDVSLNSGFTSIVNGLSNERTTQNSGQITGLDPETTYFFRVKAVDPNISERESDYSQTRQITTSNGGSVDNTPPTVFISGALSSSQQVDQTVTVSFNDNVGVNLVEVLARGGAEDIGTETVILSQNNPTSLSLNVIIPSSAWDNYGVTFYAKVSDLAGNEAVSNVFTTVVDIPTTESQTIPVNAVGVSQSDYRMFAFPYLQKNTSQVIQGAESTNDWKVQHYSASTDRNSNASTLRPGEGYWFLKRNASISITFDNASPVELDGESFTISLDNGWTQIGNPYLGTINWEAVLEYNNIPLDDEISTLQSYIGGGYSIVSNLQRYQGVFVFSSTARTIEVPLSAVNRTGGSRSWVKENGGWETVIKLYAPDSLKSYASGFGQIANALKGEDRYDIRTAPLFNEYVRAEFVEDESLVGKQLARSYHSIVTNDSWTMKVYSHFGQGSLMTMQLEGLPELKNNEIMAILDMETGYSTLLSDDLDYTFNYKDGYEIKFIKGTKDFVNQSMLVNQLKVSDIYPNPSSGLIKLSLNSPEFEQYPRLHFNVYDLSGNVVFTHQADVKEGYQEFLLDIRNRSLMSGLYMLEIEYSDKSSSLYEKITKKVYLKDAD